MDGTAWQAMGRRPWWFAASSWPWRSLTYLVSGLLLGAVTATVMAVAITAVPLVWQVAAGIVLVLGFAACAGPIARWERRRLRLVDLDPLPDPHRLIVGSSRRERVTDRLREPATWRETGFAVLCATTLCWLDAAVLGFAFGLPVAGVQAAVDDVTAWPWAPVGLLALATAPWTVTAWAAARATLTRMVLGPRDGEPGEELTDVGVSRSRLVDAFEGERARLERDLHDGPQQRLVSLGLALGMARLDLDDDDPAAVRVDEATRLVGETLAELRAAVRGLDPHDLGGDGLRRAVAQRAAGCGVPVELDVVLPHRVPPHVATTTFFLASEALTNVTKHSAATSAAVHVRHRADVLVVEVRDDGVGGARPAGGTGLSGLAERLAVVDGRLRLSSPAGGPTVLRAEIPCRCG